jgi:hypothetical protein
LENEAVVSNKYAVAASETQETASFSMSATVPTLAKTALQQQRA